MDAKLRNIFEKLTRVNRTPFILNEITEKQLDIDEGRGNYYKFEIDLSRTLVDEELNFFGDRITVEDCPDNCTLKLNYVKNSKIDLQQIHEIKAPFKKLFLNNTAGSGTLKLLVGSRGMFEAKKKFDNFLDNEKLYFGTGKDYYIYFDGTDFLIDSGTHSLEIDLATAGQATIYGGDTTGDYLMLQGNSIDTYPYMKIDEFMELSVANTKGVIIKVNGTNRLTFYPDKIKNEVNNADLFLETQGTGVLKFGTKTGTGDVAVDGFLSIKDSAGNAVKLATVA